MTTAPPPTATPGPWTATGHAALDRQLVVAGGTVAFVDDPGHVDAGGVAGLRLTGLDPATGTVRWAVPLPIPPGADILTPNGSLAVGLAAVPGPAGPLVVPIRTSTAAAGITPAGPPTSEAVAMDPTTGRVLWRSTVPWPVTATAAGLVAASAPLGGDGKAHTVPSGTAAVDAATGRVLWNRARVPTLGADTHAVLAALPGGDVLGLGPRTGQQLWTGEALHPPGGSLGETVAGVYGGTVLLRVASRAANGAEVDSLAAVGTLTGRRVGAPVPLTAPFDVSGVDPDSGVPVLTDRRGMGLMSLMGVDTRTGKVLWSHPVAAVAGETLPAEGGLVWIGGQGGNVIIDDRTGKTIGPGPAL